MKFVFSCCNGLSRLGEIDFNAGDAAVDFFVSRNRSEDDYIDAVGVVSKTVINSWRVLNGVRQNAIILPRSLLRMKFRYLSNSSYIWTVYTTELRWARHVFGPEIPYFCPTA